MRCARRSRWERTAPCSSPTKRSPARISWGRRRLSRARSGARRPTSFGQQSADGDGACLWAAVAERLRRPTISQAAELTVGDGTVTGKRQTEFGYDTISAPLPAVVAVSDAINEPRYPSLKGIMGAKRKPQETLSAADVGGTADAATTVLALNPPPARGDSRRIEDDGNGAQAILEFLAG